MALMVALLRKAIPSFLLTDMKRLDIIFALVKTIKPNSIAELSTAEDDTLWPYFSNIPGVFSFFQSSPLLPK
jgi:hypothetical protein